MSYDYNKKYKTYNKEGYGTRRSIFEILALNPNDDEDYAVIKERYTANKDLADIREVIIDGDKFTNYSAFQFGWEKSYVKSPSRSTGGSTGDLNALPTFVTPRLIINFSLMSIDDFRLIARKDLEKNEFVVTCYDPIYNRSTTNKMYFAPSELAKLHTIARVRFNQNAWEDFVEIVGVDEYTVELIGTNNEVETTDVIYYLNKPEGATGATANDRYAETGLRVGDFVVLGTAASAIVNETFGGAYEFVEWNLSDNPIDVSKGNYNNGDEIAVPKGGLILFAKWKPSSQRTLIYNYGLADPSINEETYEYVTSKTVTKGDPIGDLPAFNTPIVKIGDDEYTPYTNGAWYKTPIKGSNSKALTSGTAFWSDRDATIYLLFDPIKYTLALYHEDKSLYSSSELAYNSPIGLPMLVASGKQFDGWYTSDGKKWTATTMPPYPVALYARWKDK